MPCVVATGPLDAVVTFIIAISILLLRCPRRMEHHSRRVPLSPLISSHSTGFPGHSPCLSNLKKVHRKGSLMSQRLKQQRSYRIYKHCESWRCSCLVAQGGKKSAVRLLLPQGHCQSKGESENGIQLSERHRSPKQIFLFRKVKSQHAQGSKEIRFQRKRKCKNQWRRTQGNLEE